MRHLKPDGYFFEGAKLQQIHGSTIVLLLNYCYFSVQLPLSSDYLEKYH